VNRASQIARVRWGVDAPIAAESNMPPPSKEIEQDLRDFLRREAEADANGFTKRALHDAMKSLDGRYAEHERKDDVRHDSIVQMCRGLEARMTVAEEQTKAMKSDIEELKPAVREAHESLHDITEADLEKKAEDERTKRVAAEMKWNRILRIASQIAMAVIILIATTCVGYALGKLGLKP
jgi:hypothetical protein